MKAEKVQDGSRELGEGATWAERGRLLKTKNLAD